MKKIMLVCSAGMSTSLLVTKMEQAAEKEEEAAKVNPGLPVDVIDMKDYGMMNGEKVYNYAKKLMDE